MSFYLLAFAITWAAWLPQTAHSRGVEPFRAAWLDSPVLYVVGGLGPGVAALVMTRALEGVEGERRLWASVLRWRVRVRWWVVALVAYPAVWIVASALAGVPASDLARTASWGLIPTFLLYVVLAVPEEVGWRGFAQARLQGRRGALASGLAVGVLWALWHLPLRLDPGRVEAGSSQVAWVVGTVAAAVVYAWLFNSSVGSVLMVVILHAMANTVANLVPDAAGVAAWEAAVVTVLAVLVVVVFGSRNLAHRPRVRKASLGGEVADADSPPGREMESVP